MSIKRASFAVGFFIAAVGNVSAEIVTPPAPVACAASAMQDYFGTSIGDAIATLGFAITPSVSDAAARTDSAESDDDSVAGDAAVVTDPRQELTDFALQFVDVRYRRGGRAPSTGFDCSGFVHYVFAQVFGVDLPQNSASQYEVGKQVARADMKTGDLVFFKTRGKRISHVGIYLGEGRFIHSPTTGERVRVSNLAENYWARRFAGARRPATLI
jgi:cell wall-associated NlpC family hydrolase